MSATCQCIIFSCIVLPVQVVIAELPSIQTIVEANIQNRDAVSKIGCKMQVEEWQYRDPSTRIDAFTRNATLRKSVRQEDEPHHIALIRANSATHERITYYTDGQKNYRTDREDLRDLKDVMRQFDLPDSFAGQVLEPRTQTLMGFIDQDYINAEFDPQNNVLTVSRHEDTAGSVYMCPVLLGTLSPGLLENAASHQAQVSTDPANTDLIRVSWKHEDVNFLLTIDPKCNYRLRTSESRYDDGFLLSREEAKGYRQAGNVLFPSEHCISKYDPVRKEREYERRRKIESVSFGDVVNVEDFQLTLAPGTSVQGVNVDAKRKGVIHRVANETASVDLIRAFQKAGGTTK